MMSLSLGLSLSVRNILAGTAAFAQFGVRPYFVLDTPKNKYLTSGPEVSDNLSELMTSVALGLATTIDKDGVLKWGLHNLQHDSIPTVAAWSTSGGSTIADTASGLEVTSGGASADAAQSAADGFEDLGRYTWVFEYAAGTSGKILFRLADTSPGTIDLRVVGDVGEGAAITTTNVSDVVIVNTALGGSAYRLEVSATLATGGAINNGPRFGPNTNTAGETVFITKAWSYRSDLGGMQLNSKDGTDYLPTSGAAGYALRRDYSRLPVDGQTLGEPAGVNSLRNNTMQGAAVGVVSGAGSLPNNWATTGFPTAGITVAGFGVENGESYIDLQFDGTPFGNFALFSDTNSQIAALQNEVWAKSMGIKLIAGDETNIDNIKLASYEYSSASAFLVALLGDAITPSATYQRHSTVQTLVSATTAYVRPAVSFAWSSGAIDITLRIYMPQMEEYHVATSVIPTYGAAEARAKDEASCVIADSIPGFIQGSGSLVFEGSCDYEAGGSGFPRLIQIDDGDNFDRVSIFAAEASGVYVNRYAITSDTAQAVLSSTAIASGISFKAAARYSANDFAASYSGSAAVADTSGSVPTLTTVRLGDLNGVTRPIRVSHFSIGPYASPVASPGWSNAQLAVISGS
jgi:hypothetical protein